MNPAQVVDAGAGAPSNSTVALLDGGAPTTKEAKGETVLLHNGGAPTAAGEAVNPTEVVDAAAGTQEVGARKATAIIMEEAPGCLCLLHGIGRSVMDADHGVSKTPRCLLSPQSLGSDHNNDSAATLLNTSNRGSIKS